jgi:hypothetical protein
LRSRRLIDFRCPPARSSNGEDEIRGLLPGNCSERVIYRAGWIAPFIANAMARREALAVCPVERAGGNKNLRLHFAGRESPIPDPIVRCWSGVLLDAPQLRSRPSRIETGVVRELGRPRITVPPLRQAISRTGSLLQGQRFPRQNAPSTSNSQQTIALTPWRPSVSFMNAVSMSTAAGWNMRTRAPVARIASSKSSGAVSPSRTPNQQAIGQFLYRHHTFDSRESRESTASSDRTTQT